MNDSRKRLKRAALLERIRAVEQQQAATHAFQAEAVRQRLELLSTKTRSLAQLYALRDHAVDGADLRSAAVMGAQLRDLGRTADAQALQARRDADARLLDLATAERRRQRAEDQRRSLHRAVQVHLAKPENTPVRKTGTVIE
jgi:hypothetical protein